MTKIQPLSFEKLTAKFPQEKIPFDNSQKIPVPRLWRSPHKRAIQALELALNIEHSGYNIYLSGEADYGRFYLVNEFLKPKAKKYPTPPDLLYLHNFVDTDKPLLISLTHGTGKKFQATLKEILLNIRKEVVAEFEKDSFEKQRNTIYDSFQSKRDKLINQMNTTAEKHGFHLDLDDQGGITLYPLFEGKRLNPQDFDTLDVNLRKEIRSRGAKLTKSFSPQLRDLSKLEQHFVESEKKLEKELAQVILKKKFEVLTKKIQPTAVSDSSKKNLESYIEMLQKDILENLEAFLLKELPIQASFQQGVSQAPSHLPNQEQLEQIDHRYEANLIVDNSKLQGAPIIHDDHPTLSNLLGCIERESEMGALITDFSLIKAGSLHRANGGFLVIHLNDLIPNPLAFEGLLRALRSGFAHIEDAGDAQEVTKTKGLEPEPLKLSLKVILIGTEDLYEHLLEHDDRFSKLFKIKAHLNPDTECNADGVKMYLTSVRKIIDENKLLHFDKTALAALIDFGSKLREDRKKLSLKFPLLREVMIEASTLAKINKKDIVSYEYIEQAGKDHKYRNNLYEELYLEDYERKVIKVHTSGEAVGRVNGLSVTAFGDFEFGLPHQIACTIGVGHDGIIDLEREAALSGPIHTKAMLIIKTYLLALFARKKPIILTGSICFEQSYAGIEGDSASGAELVALLSALSDVPVNLSLAFTGAVNQSGQIMAVGGVNPKIEGFFELCRRRGLTGSQGVIIPYDNLDQVMLDNGVLDAIKNQQFFIYPVKHIDEAIELLTGLPAGKMRKDGTFSLNSLYRLVDHRLSELAKLAIKYQTVRNK
ncbi:Lon protease family protein [Desulfovibrio litoralis]|uniref:endopeptidase La n=1 Tax=Desulfovibrio litoralis DSM 11393 TaxID=1121455 RepID=A0A1M7SYR2_9BACT|nr:ATP-binding protein [Desulfovibrio litoralis]SHN63643.1 Predicted ATP-dependent protease [Desulfovibrio litoralis DSM 11393]